MTLEADQLDGEALIQPVMRAGRKIAPPVSLRALRARALRELNRLPEALKPLERGAEYPVRISPAIQQLAREVDERQFHFRDQQPGDLRSLSEQRRV